MDGSRACAPSHGACWPMRKRFRNFVSASERGVLPVLGDGICSYFFISCGDRLVTEDSEEIFLAFEVHTCHNMSTARGRHAVFRAFQEGHCSGCFGVWKAQPQSSDESSCHSASNRARRRLSSFLGWFCLAVADPAAAIDRSVNARLPQLC